ncbi:MAG: nucleotidyltransferase family protein, partial [Thermoplasmata archaeon]
MKAVVLAGGRGTRLYPLTFTRPKILVPLLNRPVLDYVLDWLKEGFDEIILACGQMRGGLRAYLETIDIKTKLNVVFEEAPLGTAGAIKNLETVLDEPFLVMNGDIISSLSVEEFLSFAMEKDG